MTAPSNQPPVFHASALEGRTPDNRRLFALGTLTLQPGLTLVLGDEGAGKTTLLRLLAGESPHAVAQATLTGHSLHTAPDAYLREVAWLDPANQAWEQVVVNDLWAQQASHFARWSPDTLDDLAEALDLQAHRHKPLYMLSTGSRRKALMAAALASGAALTLLDMPFAAVDGATCRTLRDVLADCAGHPQRAFVLADYSAPAGVGAALVLNLDESPAP